MAKELLLGTRGVEEVEYTKFSEYEDGDISSIEESIEICNGILDEYGEAIYYDVIVPFEESSKELIFEGMEILNTK